MRALYTAGTAFILVYLATTAWRSIVDTTPSAVSIRTHATPSSAQPATTGHTWFQATKPYCNSLEVETRLQSVPPPAVADGPGWMSACYALAGKTDVAHTLISELPTGERGPRLVALGPELDGPRRELGGDVLGLLIKRSPRTRYGRAARNKLKLQGLA